jgi:hypothetical protein
MFIQLFFLYLTDKSKCRFDFGVFSVHYMDVWEGQEFKTFEPVSWLPIFIYYLPHFAFLLYFHCSYFTFSIPIFFIGSNHRVSKDCRTQDCAISFKWHEVRSSEFQEAEVGVLWRSVWPFHFWWLHFYNVWPFHFLDCALCSVWPFHFWWLRFL